MQVMNFAIEPYTLNSIIHNMDGHLTHYKVKQLALRGSWGFNVISLIDHAHGAL